MANGPAQIFVHEYKDTLLFRVAGRGTMCHCAAMRRKAEQALEHGARRLLFDLRECTYFDSTFLGTLLLLNRLMRERAGGEFALVEPSPACRRLLGQMGMQHYFRQVEWGEQSSGSCCMLESDTDSASFKWNVVCAHQELASLPVAEAAAFRTLAERLAAEFKASSPGNPGP